MQISIKKLGAALGAGALVISTFAGPVAASDHHDAKNGSRFDNSFSFRLERNVALNQHNNADFDNNISIRSNTGRNRAYDNHRGDSAINTGDSNVKAHINNFANMNMANISSWEHNVMAWSKDRSMNDTNHNYDGKDYGKSSHHDYGDDHHDSHEDSDHQHEFHADMSGAQEVPGPGDPDAAGHFMAKASHEDNKLCVELHVSNIEPATAAHIHYGEKGVAGPVVVPLLTPDANGNASGCIDVDSDTLWKITNDPSHYYVNVHNAVYPDGADRGQLY